MQISDHIEKLAIFLEVIRSGSIRAAAKKMTMSQPAVSRTIQILEESVSQRLLVRSQNGVQPTEFGIKLLDLAQRIQKEIDIFSTGSESEEIETPKIRLGAYESIAVYLVPKFLKKMKNGQSPAVIDLMTASSEQLIDQLRKNLVDAVLSVNPPNYSNVVSKKIFDDYYSYYQSPQLETVKSAPLIYFPGARDIDGRKLGSYVKDSGFKSNPKFACESFEPIRALAKAGLGIAILPTRVAANDLKSGALTECRLDFSAQKKFGKHSVFFSYLKHRQGDSNILWLYRAIENYSDP